MTTKRIPRRVGYQLTHIRRDVPRCDPALLRAYEGQAAATVHEAMGRRGALDPAIKPLAADMTVCGRALTVRCHTGDNLMLVKAVSMAGPGDVIVADMGSAVASGPFGEVLAVECMARGAAGLVVSCTVRDSREIIRMGFPVFSAGLCVRGTAKATLGTINHPICIGRRDRPAGRPHRRGCGRRRGGPAGGGAGHPAARRGTDGQGGGRYGPAPRGGIAL